MWLSSAPPWLGTALLIAAAILVHLPAIDTQFLLDDFLHEAMLEGRFPGDRASWDLYNFVDDANRDALRARGLLPWWAHPELQIRFFRPLSALLLNVDHVVFGRNMFAMHLHSFVWWVLVVLAARWLYRELFGPKVALIATWIFVLSPCHAMPLAWLANRDALLSLAFGVPAVVLIARSLRSSTARAPWASIPLFSVSLLAGEYALCLGGYVLGLVLVSRDASTARRAGAIAVFAVPSAVYMGVRSAIGCGTIGSGFYTDPLHDTTLFLLLAPRRLAALFLDGWLSLSDETIDWSFSTWLVIAVALLGAATLAVAFRHVLPRLSPNERGATLAMLIGSVVAIIPVLAAVPAARLLGAAMLGIAPAAATLMDGAWFRTETVPSRGAAELAATVAIVLGFAQLVHAPIITLRACLGHRQSSLDFGRYSRTLGDHAEVLEQADIISVRGLGASSFGPFGLRGPFPRAYRVLAEAPHVLVLRDGEGSFEIITARDRGLFPRGEGNLYRSLELETAVGDVIELPEVRLTITDVEVGIPVAARVELLRSPLVFVHQTTEGYVPVELPPVGFGLTLDSELQETAPGE